VENVIFTLEAGNADFPFIMSDYHLPIKPAVDGRIDPRSADGCGPYVMQSFEPGVEAHMTRNPDYWKSDRAHFDGIELLPIIDAAARQNALMSGEVDVIDRVDLNTVHLLQRSGDIRIISVPGTQHYVFVMDSRQPDFADNNVRLALKYAVNREQLVDKILNGFGVVGNDSSDRPGQPLLRLRDGAAQLRPRPRPLPPARGRAGQPERHALGLGGGLRRRGRCGGALFRECRAGGHHHQCRRASRPMATGRTSGCRSPSSPPTGAAGRPRTGCSRPAMPRTRPGTRRTGNNERFNALLREARSELDEDRRREMYVDMQRIVRDEGFTVIPMFANYVMAASTGCRRPR
jgi:peptide/nickel transport system substrate-binding protein